LLEGTCTATTHFPNGCGGVFQLSPPAPHTTGWTYNLLYKFTGGTDGFGVDEGTIVADNQGIIYGIGLGESGGGRSIFQISP
jgi:hypothetical protein